MSRFSISRVFDAPRRRVFDCWVDPAHFEKWFGPADCVNRVRSADIRPGGYCQIEETGPLGGPFFIKLEFEEIDPVDRIVFVNSFCNEAGEFAKHPFLPLWPDKMRAHVTFEDVGEGTKISVIWDPLDADEAQTAFFVENQWMGQAGWSQSFDRLTKVLAHPTSAGAATA